LRSDPSDWDTYPEQAFRNWLARVDGRGGTGFRSSSLTIYEIQWRCFVKYIQERGGRITEVTATDVSSFLNSLHSENRDQRERYRQLLERIFASIHDGNPPTGYVNPAAFEHPETETEWTRVAGNLPTSFLTPAERGILIRYLESSMEEMAPDDRWRELRNRALVATFLGAGLKVAEATGLTVHCMAETDQDGWLEIGMRGSQYLRRVLPAPFAVRILRHWMIERMAGLELARDGGDQSEFLFPSHQRGGRLHPVTPLRNTALIVCASGLSDSRAERSSPQTLRNSFMAELFESGHTTREVASALGFETILTAERMKHAWQQWKDGQ
jgi:integrase/recombinase XerC